MKTTKTIFALLFSFALIWTQTVFVSAAPVKEKKSCCVNRACCCATTPVPNSPSQPTAPPKTASQTELQSVVAAGLAILQQPAPEVKPAFFSHAPLPHSSTIPLFQRNCSFLI